MVKELPPGRDDVAGRDPLTESVARAMDGSDSRIVPFLPYILQDTWELGTDPETVIDLVRRQVEENEFLEGEVECAVLAIKRDRPR